MVKSSITKRLRIQFLLCKVFSLCGIIQWFGNLIINPVLNRLGKEKKDAVSLGNLRLFMLFRKRTANVHVWGRGRDGGRVSPVAAGCVGTGGQDDKCLKRKL